MLARTHLAMALFVAAVFWNSVSSKILFTFVLLIATLMPDIDNTKSFINEKTKIGKIAGFFSKHRGMFHSMTFAVLFSLLIVFMSPSIALPVFVGYSLHIFADSFTKEGVQTLWPLRFRSKGNFTTGSWTEYLLIGLFLLLAALVIL